MIGNAIALAAVTTGGFVIIYKKLPRKVRRFLEKHNLMTDLAAVIAVYALLGGTLTALMAGALCGLFVSVLLAIANNKDDFLYIYDAWDFLRRQMAEFKTVLNEYGKQYRKKHETVVQGTVVSN